MTSWITILSQVKHLFDRESLPWALFGGAAVAVYAPTRKIRDVDILTIDSALRPLADSFSTDIGDYYSYQQFVKIGCVEVYNALQIHTDAGTHLFALDEEMISRCEQMKLASIKIPILSREDHVVLKAILQRGSKSKSQDIEDILIMNRIGPLDIQYIQHRIELCAAQGYADNLLWELGVLPARPVILDR